MTEQDLIKFKELSMQDGRLNLSWFADYVAAHEREACAKVADEFDPEMKMSNYGQVIANRIRARGQA